MPAEKGCLVVAREILEKHDLLHQGFCVRSQPELEEFLRIVQQHGCYKDRFGKNGVESDRSWQQIIPFVIFTKNDNSFFLYQRGESRSTYDEKRLHGRVSCGIGGHIEPKDRDFWKGMYRELDEEITIAPGPLLPFLLRPQKAHFVGLLKDDLTPVGMHHLGVVFKIMVPTAVQLDINPDDGGNQHGRFVTIEEYSNLMTRGDIVPEEWTKMVMEKLFP